MQSLPIVPRRRAWRGLPMLLAPGMLASQMAAQTASPDLGQIMQRLDRLEKQNQSMADEIRQLRNALAEARGQPQPAQTAPAQTASEQTIPAFDKIQNQQDLDRAGAALDAALFDSYNRCDLDKFASFLDENVEFYHDQGGITLGRAALTDSVKKNICGKVTRELVPGTLKVYHMKGYGFVEMGVHRFHHPGHDDTEGVGEGQFIHLWQYKDGAWKVTRVISYDHHAAGK